MTYCIIVKFLTSVYIIVASDLVEEILIIVHKKKFEVVFLENLCLMN